MNLDKIDRQVTEQVSILIVQQDALIQYYTSVVADTQFYRVANVVSFAQFAATFSYMNTLFSTWKVSEPGDPTVCKESLISLTDAALGTLRDMSKGHNTPILNRFAVVSYFTSTGALLGIQDRQAIADHFGQNINVFNFAMRDSFSSFIEERIGLLTINMLTNINDSKDYRGLFHVFPGGCSDAEYYQSMIGTLV